MVIPLPARLPIVCALLDALSDAWEAEYGAPPTNAHMSQENTPWGLAMVVREGDAPAEEHPL